MAARPPLTPDEVRKVARLSRLALTDGQVDQYRTQLSAILGYVERLQRLDLKGVEPMPHVGETVNRLDDDVPGPTLTNATLMQMAPETLPPFIKVPKVIGDGGAA